LTISNAASPYQKIGGEAGVRNLVKAFYDLVEKDPLGQPLLIMHNRGHSVAYARDAQFEFLSGFLGGPQLYFEHHRNSNVRTIHAHLKIGTLERDAWLACMDKALHHINVEPDIRALLMNHFSRIAEALRTGP
jgi:hemoglobin